MSKYLSDQARKRKARKRKAWYPKQVDERK